MPHDLTFAPHGAGPCRNGHDRNRSHRSRLRSAASAITAAAVLAVTVGAVTIAPAMPAHAAVVGCTPEFDVVDRVPGFPEYSFERCGVPDYDQIRMALPNLGRMYCVPTSAVDWMVYLADRGARSVMPGTSAANTYANIDQAIASMGTAMGTNATTGTVNGAVAGLVSWFDQSYGGRGGDYFSVYEHYGMQATRNGATRVDRPSARDLATAAAGGSLVMPNIVWLELNEAGFMAEVGAHTVALASARPDLGTHFGGYTLGFVDPATVDPANDYTNTQGEWAVDLRPARPAVIRTGPSTTEYLDKIWGQDYSSGYLRGAIFILPKLALFPDPAAGRMTLRRAVQLDEGPGDRVIEGLDERVIDLALGVDGAATTALLDDGRLLAISHLDGTSTTTATIPGATNIVLDDQGRTAVIDTDGRITVLDPLHNPVTAVDVPGATGLGFSQRLHAFVTFDGPNQELVAVTDTAEGELTQRRLPLLKPDGPPIAPTATLSVNPSTGIIGLLEPGTNTLTRTIVTEGRFVTSDSITLGDGAPLDGLVADATGAWYSTHNGEIVAFDIDGTELPDNPFAGQASAPGFEVFQPMNIGTPPDVPNVLPQDAPRVGDQLALSQASATETVGDAHPVTVTLTDETGTPLAGRRVAYRTTGANPDAGDVITDGNGQATISWVGSTVGTDDLTAWEDIDGDGAHGGREVAASLQVTWTERTTIATTATLTSSQNPSRAGRPVTFTVTVAAAEGTDVPAGTVQFSDAGVDLGPPVALDGTGRATLTTSTLRAGTHRIDATYTPAPSTRHLASSARLDQTVRCAPLDILCLILGLLGPKA